MPRLANVRADLTKFAKKAYRDGFLETTTRGAIALQVRALRNKFRLTQEQFAEKTNKKQSVISRLEDPDGSQPSVQTLLDVASACDVALVVRFVSYPELLIQTSDMTPAGLEAETIFESLENARVPQPSYNQSSGLYARFSGLPSALANEEPKQNRLSAMPTSGLGLTVGEAQYLALQD